MVWFMPAAIDDTVDMLTSCRLVVQDTILLNGGAQTVVTPLPVFVAVC